MKTLALIVLLWIDLLLLVMFARQVWRIEKLRDEIHIDRNF